MGLDITAYSHVSPVGMHTADLWCAVDNHVTAYAYSDFPRSFAGIPVLATHTSSSGEYKFMQGGCYETTSQTKEMRFRAGSYTGYNRWREHLAALFNPGRHEQRPFYELIWFADNEGTIGATAAAYLLEDFEQYADVYRAHVADRVDTLGAAWYIDSYNRWTEAFRLAAASGIVEFH